MKTLAKWLSLTVFVLAASLLPLLAKENQTIPTQIQTISKISSGLPVRLIIPKIGVDTVIKQVGVTSEGNMDVPDNAIDVGWFKLGPRPGEKNSAVIDGHFNNENGEPAVFFNLYKLEKGDKIFVRDNKGLTFTFLVRGSHVYDLGLAEEEVFVSTDDTAHLNLITCDGVWDGVKKSYTKRLVVFADAI